MFSTQVGARRAVLFFDPLERLFRLLTSVRFALLLIALLASASLLGVVLPQVPGFARDDPQSRLAWLAVQQGRFGNATWWLNALGFFDVFHSHWFLACLALLTLSVSVCSASRFPPVWRSIRRPQLKVADAYFERARWRYQGTAAADSEALLAWLRRRRYKLWTETSPEGSLSVYADRYRFAALATFVSHLALILFLAGGLVTAFSSFRQQVLIPEGQSRPVLPLDSPRHMQVAVTSFERRQDAQGFDTDYRTDLVIYRDGRQVAAGTTTVNRPLHYDGFVFHQSAFSEDGARLVIKDPAGRTVFDDVLLLQDRMPALQVVVRDKAGAIVARQWVAPTALVGGNSVAGKIDTPRGEFWAVTHFDGAPASDTPTPPFGITILSADRQSAPLTMGGRATVDDYDFEFTSLGAVKYAVADLPPLQQNGLLVEMDDLGPGPARLILLSPDAAPVTIGDGQSASADGYQLFFEGQKSFSGITVKKDPGSTFIWVATALLLSGLLVTFYLPRRRLWLHMRDGVLKVAGLGDGARMQAEIDALAAVAGSDAARREANTKGG